MTKARVPSGGPGLSYVGRPAGPSAGRAWPLGVEVFDTATKKTPLTPVDKNTTYGSGQASLTDDGVTWVEDEDEDGTDTGRAGVKRAGLHGSGPATVLPEARAGALYAYELTASDDAVTELSLPPAPSWDNATLPKLHQVAPDGKGGAQRVSCNRGDQVCASADTGSRVLRPDGTAGWTSLVKRDRPAGKC
ncbi:hypothetical protein ACFVEN_07395 [Streptomyces sp. NPDC057681]|uniref:hypothetical protein n=1 Tax=Streptomyces sp. NPDC057681 TaxID=3346209 RepID=UPI00368F92A4